MKNYLIFFLLLISFISNAQNNCSCNNLKEGVFETYEDNKKVGILYRKGLYQIEKEVNGNIYNVAKIKSDKCMFYINSYEVKNELDTITWSVNYKRIESGSYAFIAEPTYLNINFLMKGKVIKISNFIKEKEVLKMFEKLNN